jgi:hypothetical protein
MLLPWALLPAIIDARIQTDKLNAAMDEMIRAQIVTQDHLAELGEVDVEHKKILDSLLASVATLSQNADILHMQLGQLESLVFALSPYKEVKDEIEDDNALGVLANKFGNPDVLRVAPAPHIHLEATKYEPIELKRSDSSSSNSSFETVLTKFHIRNTRTLPSDPIDAAAGIRLADGSLLFYVNR